MKQNQQATLIDENPGVSSLSPGKAHKRVVINGLGSKLQEAMAIRYADKPPLLSWNWKKIAVSSTSKPIYININSFAKRMGITKSEAKTILGESKNLEEAVLKGRLKQLKISDTVEDFAKKTNTKALEILSMLNFDELDSSSFNQKSIIYFPADSAVYTVKEELGEGSYNNVYKLQNKVNPTATLALRIPKRQHIATLAKLQARSKVATDKIQAITDHKIYCHFSDKHSSKDSTISTEAIGTPLIKSSAGMVNLKAQQEMLSKVLEDYGKLDPPLTQKELIKQILDCLKFLRENGMQHGDIRLQNFLLFKEEGQWRLKMIDFDSLKEAPNSDTDLSAAGRILQDIVSCTLEEGGLTDAEKKELNKFVNPLSNFNSTPQDREKAYVEAMKWREKA